MSARRHGGGSPTFLRRVLLWGLAALAALAVAGFIGYAQLLSYLQGQEFRSVLQNEIMNKTQAELCTMKDTLSIDANRVSVQALDLRWRSGLLQKVGSRGIHAEIKRSALLDKKLHFTRLVVEEGSLDLDLDSKSEQEAPLRSGKSSFLSGLAPTRAELEHFECKDFNATLRSNGREYSLTDSALTATPRQGQKNWELRLSSGRLHTPLPVIGDSNLKGATILMNGKAATLSLSDARLMLSPGELIANAVLEQSTGNWSTNLRANSVDVSRLIGEDWKKRLSGSLYGRMQMDGNAEGLQVAEGKLSLQQGVLEALPFLENLPVGNTYPYRSLKLEKATARLSYPHADAARNIDKAWLLDNIDLRAEGGWLRVQGHVLVDEDGSLGGSLLIGLPENIAAGLAPVESPLHRSIFNAEGEQGYLWLRMNLSGSLSNPQEDLSVRLTTLLNAALPDAAKALRKLLLPQKADAPAATESPAAEAPRKLMEEAGKAAGDIIGSGLRRLF